MSGQSAIEWTEATWNPVVGCTRVSRGCDHCYAVRHTRRLAGKLPVYQGLVNDGKNHFNGTVRTIPERLDQPLRWRKPRRIFVNSMSDLFHPDVPDRFILQVFIVMAQSLTWAKGDRHIFQILTKRPERMADFCSRLRWKWGMAMGGPWRMEETGDRPLNPVATLLGGGRPDPPPNIWLGTSVEDQGTANDRVPHLLRTPAAVRFLSCEPLLGPIRLDDLVVDDGRPGEWHVDALTCDVDPEDDPPFYGATVDWVIVGGESGPGARPMHPAWARSIRDQCQAAGVPFFLKQRGAWTWDDPGDGSDPDGMLLQDGRLVREREQVWLAETIGAVPVKQVGKKAAGRDLDGRTWDEMPKVEDDARERAADPAPGD